MNLKDRIKGWFKSGSSSGNIERPKRTSRKNTIACVNYQPVLFKYSIENIPETDMPIHMNHLTAKQMERVVKAEQDPDTGKPSLNIVRKTVDDILSRTSPFTQEQVEYKTNHERIWNESCSRDLAFILYALGFNSYGVVDGTWIYNHHDDIERFLGYLKSLGASMKLDDKTGDFQQMRWCDVKSASWLLFHAGCYKGKPKPFAYTDDLFREAENRAIAEEKEEMRQQVLGIHQDAQTTDARYAKPPTRSQLAYANQIYHRLVKSGYENVGLPDLRTFGTVGKFIGTWQGAYLQLGSSPKGKRG